MPEGGVYTETDIEITDVYKGNLNVGDIVTIVEAYCTTGGRKENENRWLFCFYTR